MGLEDTNDKKIEKNISKRLSTELLGDYAVMANVLETVLQIHGTKSEKDNMLISLALKALNKSIDDCRVITGKMYPNHDDVINFLS
jgi:hypothetical protein